ncbi:MAG: RNA methyltransferase [Betaproteobacteria bacterium RIFCSPLOWO2_12_FULL_65_14]|nr:MAG: RNA methyltransferase [Betaproteobacteria bacterium RIFCSPLOWO2_12_FULL_65_14]
MTTIHCVRRWLMAIAIGVMAVCAQAQAAEEWKPTLGQPGKDVIWLPSPQLLVDKMLDMARVTPADFVMDLGSGDGRTVITAAKRGARALGIEFDPNMVGLSRRNAAAAGVGDKAKFVEADIFETDLSQATVITLFLLPELNMKLRPKLLDMRPGTRIVSNSFDMEDWEADQVADLGCETYCTGFLWIVPAKVQGIWRLDDGNLVLQQKFQKLTGALATESTAAKITTGRMRGNEISFVVGRSQYRGRVEGAVIKGTVATGGSITRWTARRQT